MERKLIEKRFHKDKLFKCNSCKKTFKNASGLRQHKQVHLVPDKPLQCKLCAKSFQYQRLLTRHQEVHTRYRTFRCEFPTCQKSFLTRDELSNHSGVHSGVTFPCNLCDDKFQCESYLKKHLKRNHTDSKPKCQFCGGTFTTKASLQGHIRLHTNEKPFKCKRCPQRFIDSTRLRIHQHREGHGTAPRTKIKCQQCYRSFFNDYRLERHVKTVHHTNQRPICPICKKSFNQNSALNRHLKKHDPLQSSSHKCGFCPRGFCRGDELKMHLRTHLQEKLFTCYFCKKRFNWITSYTQHLSRAHTMERPYQCQLCKKEVSCTLALREHQRKHAKTETRTKRNCYFCNRGFVTRAGLNLHTRTHLNENQPSNCEL